MAANRDAQGRPQRVGLLLADIAAGVYAAQACTAALLGKARDGRGRHVQLNLFEVCCALQSTVLAENALCGGQPSAGVSAPNGVFAAADGFITLLALNNDQFERLCRALDLPHWLQDARFASNALRLAHKRELHAELDALIARHPRAWWEQRLDAQGALHASVQNLCDVVSHPRPHTCNRLRSWSSRASAACSMRPRPGRRWAGGRALHRVPASIRHRSWPKLALTRSRYRR